LGEIIAYPNPFRDELFVSVPAGLQVEGFRVIDLSGRQIMVQGRNALISGAVSMLDLSGLAAGSYLLEILTSSGNRTILLERM
jgi:hypothetical protein